MKTTCHMLLLFSVVTFSTAALGEETRKSTIRIGTYDSRAIAIAYAPSKFNPVAEKMKELSKAKADGNQERIKEIEAWGPKHQRQLHRQAFSNVPVHDLLRHVEGQLPEIAESAGVVAIVPACDFTEQGVETIDVTDRLVQLFEPTEKTLASIRSIRDKPPVDLDDFDKGHRH